MVRKCVFQARVQARVYQRLVKQSTILQQLWYDNCRGTYARGSGTKHHP